MIESEMLTTATTQQHTNNIAVGYGIHNEDMTTKPAEKEKPAMNQNKGKTIQSVMVITAATHQNANSFSSMACIPTIVDS